MLTTLLIVSVAFDAWLIFCIWKTRKQMLFWRSQNLRSAEQAVHNGEIARRNFQHLETQKKFTRDVERLFWVAWFMAFFCWFMWRRESRKNSGQ